MEFIGDRVLGLLMAEWLAERFPDEQEGALGPRLALLVSRPVLAEIAEEVGLGRALSIAAGEARAGVRRRATVLADGLEAALGAIYLDGGLAPARRFVRGAWASRIEAQGRPPKDPKTELQEHTLAKGWGLPRYAVVSADGPPHAPCFRITVSVPGLPPDGPCGDGVAGSKRLAERAAAADLLARLATSPNAR
jgi:ribonuclease-3